MGLAGRAARRADPAAAAALIGRSRLVLQPTQPPCDRRCEAANWYLQRAWGGSSTASRRHHWSTVWRLGLRESRGSLLPASSPAIAPAHCGHPGEWAGLAHRDGSRWTVARQDKESHSCCPSESVGLVEFVFLHHQKQIVFWFCFCQNATKGGTLRLGPNHGQPVWRSTMTAHQSIPLAGFAEALTPGFTPTPMVQRFAFMQAALALYLDAERDLAQIEIGRCRQFSGMGQRARHLVAAPSRSAQTQFVAKNPVQLAQWRGSRGSCCSRPTRRSSPRPMG
ncbi:hypothetical protein [Paracoccus mutanolyticus]|uniref:hypothetical protein n=1 Tax=Paracoccus mutanolyticus TaxID=1499308 RepID=UPI0011AE3FE4|nr:hypothetical protein [Paracoccus mutanolyticus]